MDRQPPGPERTHHRFVTEPSLRPNNQPLSPVFTSGDTPSESLSCTYLSFADLPDSHRAVDASQLSDTVNDALTSVLLDIRSKDWRTQFAAMHSLQSLIKFHAALIAPSVAEMIAALLFAVRSARSAVCRNSLRTFEVLCRCLPKEVATQSSLIVPDLLHKAVSPYQFLATDALAACHALTAPACASEPSLVALVSQTSSKNAETVALAASLLLESLNSIQQKDPTAETTQSMEAATGAALLTGTHHLLNANKPQARNDARNILRTLGDWLSPEVLHNWLELVQLRTHEKHTIEGLLFPAHTEPGNN